MKLLLLHLKDKWLSLQMIFWFGFRRERVITQSTRLTMQRWRALTCQEPTDHDLERLVDRLRVFEDAHNRRPNAQETDVLIQQIIYFP